MSKEGSASGLVEGGEVDEGLSPLVSSSGLVGGGEGCPPGGVSVVVSAGSLAEVILAGVANGLMEGVAFSRDGVETPLPGVLIGSKGSPIGGFVKNTALTQSLVGGCSVGALASTQRGGADGWTKVVGEVVGCVAGGVGEPAARGGCPDWWGNR